MASCFDKSARNLTPSLLSPKITVLISRTLDSHQHIHMNRDIFAMVESLLPGTASPHEMEPRTRMAAVHAGRAGPGDAADEPR